MAGIIAVLEDDSDRLAAIQARLCESFPQYKHVPFDNAPDMIDWLRAHLPKVAAISLDHDLGPNRQRGGEVFDPGTGRDVADFLATCPPRCPMIIATTNSFARPGMELVLHNAGWQTFKVLPSGDLEWIDKGWTAALRTILRLL